MTDKLKTLMHDRADSVDFAQPDLDTITRAGDRRARGRTLARTTLGLAVAASAVLAAAVVVPQLGNPEPDNRVGGPASSPGGAGQPAGLPAVSWASGSVIHTPTSSIDVGHEVAAYVRLATGYATVDPDGVVRSVSDGVARKIGEIAGDSPHLVADEEGSLVGWVGVMGDEPKFVVYDQAEHHYTGDAMPAPAPDENGTSAFYAIDDTTAYWRADEGAVGFDLLTGDLEVIEASPGDGFDIRDAQNGLLAFWGRQGMRVGATPADSVELTGVYGDMGALSPTGRHYTQDADEPMVLDTRTGERIEFALADYDFASGYEWLDADTLVMIAAKQPETSPVQLLTCSVTQGSCSVTHEFDGTFEELAGSFQLPIGESVTGDS